MATVSQQHPADGGHDSPDAHGAHPSFLAHHFDTPAQQFDSGKLGIWVFLVQELLFFSGLFVAYSVYRSNHPEVFAYAHQFLDARLGAFNTVVLITSSLTIAWAVRCAQLNRAKATAALLGITFLLAGVFLAVKYVEYEHKWKDGLLWGYNYSYSAAGPHGAATATMPAGHLETGGHVGAGHVASAVLTSPEAAKNVHIFFGIYFAMTALHGLHVLIGMGVILWIMVRAMRGEFHSQYFGPVEYTGLYWHLVDLIWIYLFPLLYLIGP